METIVLNPSDDITKKINSSSSSSLDVILREGVYKEKVCIFRDKVSIRGDGNVVVTYSDHRIKTTGESATFTIGGKDITLENITVRNSFDYFKAIEERKSGKSVDTQAVALRTVYGADNTRLKNVSLFSYHDTLYLDRGFHLLENCKVYGNIDFIFGAGEALIRNSRIISLSSGIVCAPSTMKGEKGFTFENCIFDKEGGVEKGSVFLSRPWHPSGSDNRSPNAIFISPDLKDHISSTLWVGMKSVTPFGFERVWTENESRFLAVNPRWIKED